MILSTAAPAAAQFYGGPCSGRDYPVLVYDARFRLAHIVPRSVGLDPSAGLSIAAQPLESDPTRFLCDGKPVEVYVVNRKLKESFNATVTGVVSISSAVIAIRGVQPSVLQPSTTTPAPTAPPVSKGGATIAPLQIPQVVDNLLSAETFNLPEQSLKEEAEQLRAQARQLDVQLDQYLFKLEHIIQVGLAPAVPAEAPQGTATLEGTAAAFEAVSAQIAAELTNPPLADIETRFDRINVKINLLIQDVQQRLNPSIQSFPIVDQLNSLQGQMETFEASLRQYSNDIQTVQQAVLVVQSLLNTNEDYLKERNLAEIRRELQSQFPANSTPNMDATSIATIAQKYLKALSSTTTENPFVPEPLRGLLSGLTIRLRDYQANRVPDAALLTPGRMRGNFKTVSARLPVLRLAIDRVNQTEAAAFSAINTRYQDIRIPSPTALYLNLSAYSGNLSVFYSISEVETFQPYLMANETLQPSGAALQPSGSGAGGAPTGGTAAGGAGATGAGGAAAGGSGAGGAGAGGAGAGAAAAGGSGSSPPSFQVHHFDHGTIFGGFAASSLRTNSFGVGQEPCPNQACLTGNPSGDAYTITQSTSNQGKSWVAGVEIYMRPQDMYPGVRPRWWGAAWLLGTSLNPLNQYFAGVGFEPFHIHGFTVGGGIAFGAWNRLAHGYYTNEYLGPTTVATLSTSSVTGIATVPAPSAPPTTSAFHKSAFLMVGFDWNIFQTIFGKLTNVGSAAPAPTGSGSSQ